MSIHRFLLFMLSAIMNVFTQAALTMAYVTDTDVDFDPYEYNIAKIRDACLQVHGERWFKKNILLERKYRACSLSLSNTDFMETIFRVADSGDLMDMKSVLDYMAYQNDTIYLSICEEYFEKMFANNVTLNKYIKALTPSNFGYSTLGRGMHFLHVGNLPEKKSNNLIVIQFKYSSIGNLTSNWWEYSKKCEKEGCMDISNWHFDKGKVTDRDIDLYYDFIVDSDRRHLQTRPTRLIPIGVRYEYNPNERIVSIKDGNVFIEPAD